MTETIEWIFIDSRIEDPNIPPITQEWCPCKNGHSCFIPHSMGPPKSDRELKVIFKCETCGIEVFRIARFKVYREEIDDAVKILYCNDTLSPHKHNLHITDKETL